MKPVKDMTLIEVVDECVKMWEWVVEHLEEFEERGGFTVIDIAKGDYFRNIGNPNIFCDCLFCEYDEIHDGDACDNCPACILTKNKEWSCYSNTINYDKKPHAFLKELKRIQKIAKGN